MATYITPTYMMNFETDMRFVMTNSWSRTLKNLWWPRLMLLETTGSARQYIEWMLETAKIAPLGPKGASMPHDPLVAVSQELDHEFYGNALELFRSDIEDDKVARAPKWASDTGSAQAYWPQRLLVQMMQNGTAATSLAFDGRPFFDAAHPVNPYDAAGATIANGRLYSNLHIGTAFTVENLARVTAYIESIRHPGDAPMGALPTITVFPSNFRYRANQFLNAEIYNDVLTAGASASNTIKTAYQFEPPIITAELNNEPTTWYVGIPADQDAFDGAFGYLEREAFSINTYSPLDQAALANINTFQWKNRGRNGSFYGLPYRFHRCESAGVQPSYLSSLTI
jgi:hypothetical protein